MLMHPSPAVCRLRRSVRPSRSNRPKYRLARRLEVGAKPSTINYELAMLRRGFRLGRALVSSQPKFEMLKVDNARKGFFEHEQYRASVHASARVPKPSRLGCLHHWLAHQVRVAHPAVEAGGPRQGLGET